MGRRRLQVAAILLGLLSLLAAVYTAPQLMVVATQPDSAGSIPGGILVVDVMQNGDPVANFTVTADAADGSWNETCHTNQFGRCVFLPLQGAKGTVVAGDAERSFFLLQENTGVWHRDIAEEDEGSPIGLGPRDALPMAFAVLASVFGFIAAVAMWRHAAVRLAMIGVGLSLVLYILQFNLYGLAISGFAAYTLVKEAQLFDGVPLDELDTDEEE